MVFRYRTQAQKNQASRFSRAAIARSTPDEQLTGLVKGEVARADEERFARALDKLGYEYYFRSNPTDIPTGRPGWVELDFLILLEE